MRASPAAAVLALALSAGPACVGDAGGSPGVARDSAGVTIVESTAPAWGEGDGWEVDVRPVLDLAESGDGPAHEFFDATDAARLPDGSLAVADDGSYEIRLFTPAGAHRGTLGREGDGPGEFRRLRQVIALPGDSILAYDFWQARVTVLGPDGTVARVVGVEGATQPQPLFPVESGGFVALAMDYTGFRERLGLHRMPSPVVRLGNDGALLDTLVVVPGFESVVFSRGDGFGLWGRNAHLAVRGDEVYVGSADSVEYRVLAPDGRLRRIVRVPGYDLTLSREEVVAERSAYMPDPSEASPTRREIMELQPERTHRPGYSDMVVDADGYVWLERYQGRHERAEPTEWLVFDPAGAWLGSVALPPRFHVFRIGPDWILGKRPDGLDVEHVQLLALSRGRRSG